MIFIDNIKKSLIFHSNSNSVHYNLGNHFTSTKKAAKTIILKYRKSDSLESPGTKTLLAANKGRQR